MTPEVPHLCMGCMRPCDTPVCPVCGWHSEMRPANDYCLPPETRLQGRYVVGRVLGYGGFGVTYLGWDSTLNVKTAIKEYFPTGLAVRHPDRCTVFAAGAQRERYQNGLERFLSEARDLARFDDHPGIVGVRDFFADNGTAYMVMQYLEGWTLKAFLALQPAKTMSFAGALRVLLPILQALDSVHGKGLVHRDVSPDNLYLTRQGQVKLLDFGAARETAMAQEQSVSVVLKPGYAPLEQYQSHGRQGAWTDVYAAAATLHFLITGEAPPDAISRAAAETLQLPSQMGADLSPAAEDVLLCALSLYPEDRFQSVAEFKAALLDAVGMTEQQCLDLPLPDVAVVLPPLYGYGWTVDSAGSQNAGETVSVYSPYSGSPTVGQVLPATTGRNQATEGRPTVRWTQRLAGLRRFTRQQSVLLFLALLMLCGFLLLFAHGTGVKTLADGSVYQGEYAWNKPEGRGVLRQPDGSVLTGVFAGGKLQGEGDWRDGANHLAYQGGFKDSLFEGLGHYTDQLNGSSYEGGFLAGLRSGSGVLKTRAFTYEGEFVQDRMQGKGSMTFSDGTIMRGIFQDGLREGVFVREPTDVNMLFASRYANDKRIDREQPIAPFTVSQLQFRNEDDNGNVLSAFATRFAQSEVRSIAVHVDAVNDLSRGFEGSLYVAYITPQGAVLRDGDSNVERATFVMPVQFAAANEERHFQQGWGDGRFSAYEKGVYKVQLWWDDVKAAEGSFEVY